MSASRRGEEWAGNRDLALSPESIAKVRSCYILADTVVMCFSQSYLYLTGQDRSAWTWELDRRSCLSECLLG
jgi:hypothetical protein